MSAFASTSSSAMAAAAVRRHGASWRPAVGRANALVVYAGKKSARKTKAPPVAAPKPTDAPAGSSDGESSLNGVNVTAAATRGRPVVPPPVYDAMKVPYGDASGAALLLKDVMLSVADTDLLNFGCATVMKGQVVGLVGGNGGAVQGTPWFSQLIPRLLSSS